MHHFFEACKDCDLPLEWILAEEQVENGVLFVLAGLEKTNKKRLRKEKERQQENGEGGTFQ